MRTWSSSHGTLRTNASASGVGDREPVVTLARRSATGTGPPTRTAATGPADRLVAERRAAERPVLPTLERGRRASPRCSSAVASSQISWRHTTSGCELARARRRSRGGARSQPGSSSEPALSWTMRSVGSAIRRAYEGGAVPGRPDRPRACHTRTVTDLAALDGKLTALRDELDALGRVVVAFSGGADSAFLAAVAQRTLGAERVHAVTAVSPSLAGSEHDDCRALAAEWGLRWTPVETDEMARAAYRINDTDRCYHCKAELMDVLVPIAAADGARIVLGVNVDDLGDHRPGQRAASEAGAAFPLVAAGFTKADVRGGVAPARAAHVGQAGGGLPGQPRAVRDGGVGGRAVAGRAGRGRAARRWASTRSACATTATRPASRSSSPTSTACSRRRHGDRRRRAGGRLPLRHARPRGLPIRATSTAERRRTWGTVGAMKLAMMINYSGDFHADVTRIQELEKAGLDVVWVAEAYSYDAISQVGFLAAKTERVEIGTGIINVFSRTATADRPDRGRLRLRQRRPVHPRPRRLRPAGHRGLPRRAVRAPDAAHPRVHRGVPHDVAARAGRLRRPDRADPAAGRPGHRAGQAAQADQPPQARRHPDLLGQPDGQERHQHGPPRQRLAADLLRPREVPAGVGRRPRRPAWPTATRRSGRCRSPPAAWSRSATSTPATAPTACSTWPARRRRCTSAAWAPGTRTSTTRSPRSTATSTRPPRSRTSTCPVARRRRPPPSPAQLLAGTNLVGPESYVAERIAAYKEAGVTHLSVNPVGADPVKTVETLRSLLD